MTDRISNSEWIVMRGNQMFQMCRLCFEPIHDGPCEKSAAMIEYWNARAADADANAARCRGMAMEIANRQLSELAALRAALAQAQAEIQNCLQNIAELTTQRRALQLELSDAQAERDAASGSELAWRRGFADILKERDAALEELRLIKQTTRPVPGDLLDEKNQHGEYSMDTLPFDYALYGIAGEPQHDTSGKPCWCGAKADGEGVVVHRDMAEVLTAARQLGRFDAQPDYAAARSAVEGELRAIAHIYGTAAGLEPLDSVSGMLSQISNIIAGVASQRDAATARAELSEKHAEKEKAERTHQQYRAERAENALSRCRVQALDQAAKIVEAYAGSYPTDMFPPDSNDRDSISGTALRRVLPMVAGAIRAVISGPEGAAVIRTATPDASSDLYPNAERTDAGQEGGER